MVEEKKVDDLVIKLEVSDVNERKYVDIELSYTCKDQAEIDKIVNAINNFVKSNGEGLTRQNINILGYSMY